MEDVAAGEEADDVCDDLVRSPTVHRSVGPDRSDRIIAIQLLIIRASPEYKGVLVTLAVTKNNLIELVHNIAGTFVHQVQSCFLIGFGELVSV